MGIISKEIHAVGGWWDTPVVPDHFTGKVILNNGGGQFAEATFYYVDGVRCGNVFLGIADGEKAWKAALFERYKNTNHEAEVLAYILGEDRC